MPFAARPFFCARFSKALKPVCFGVFIFAEDAAVAIGERGFDSGFCQPADVAGIDFQGGAGLIGDEQYMRRALDLAARGQGAVDPNPSVGCVAVRDGEIIGEGWHKAFGGLHAEREALADIACRAKDPTGATFYVTLEPCCHYGKTPPCAQALIEAGAARVVIGTEDPNPLVKGKGIAALQNASISVTTGVLQDECAKLNRAFFHFVTTGLPYVIAKFAMTLDGKIATSTGRSKWITGEAARRRVHVDRARYQAILVGVGTVCADDPLLTCRLGSDMACRIEASRPSISGNESDTYVYTGVARNPVRVICDTHLRMPLAARVLASAASVPTLCATCSQDKERIGAFRKTGCEIVVLAQDDTGRVSLQALMAELGKRNIISLMIEGGPRLLGAAMDAGIVQAVQAYIAPKIFGGSYAKSPVGGKGVAEVSDAFRCSDPVISRLGSDVLLECELLGAGDGRTGDGGCGNGTPGGCGNGTPGGCGNGTPGGSDADGCGNGTPGGCGAEGCDGQNLET